MPEDFAIWSIEHTAWWRADSMGYTTRLAEAGHYAGTEALRIIATANRVACQECLIPWDRLRVRLVDAPADPDVYPDAQGYFADVARTLRRPKDEAKP